LCGFLIALFIRIRLVHPPELFQKISIVVIPLLYFRSDGVANLGATRSPRERTKPGRFVPGKTDGYAENQGQEDNTARHSGTPSVLVWYAKYLNDLPEFCNGQNALYSWTARRYRRYKSCDYHRKKIESYKPFKYDEELSQCCIRASTGTNISIPYCGN